METWLLLIIILVGELFLVGIGIGVYWIYTNVYRPKHYETLVFISPKTEKVIKVHKTKDIGFVDSKESWLLKQEIHGITGVYFRGKVPRLNDANELTTYYNPGNPNPLAIDGTRGEEFVDSASLYNIIKTKIFDASTYIEPENKIPKWVMILIIVGAVLLIVGVMWYVTQGKVSA